MRKPPAILRTAATLSKHKRLSLHRLPVSKVLLIVAPGSAGIAHAAGPSTLFGTSFLTIRLTEFVLPQLLVAGIGASFAAPGRRVARFWWLMLCWAIWCLLLTWAAPLSELLLAAARGATWGSYSGSYPGHWQQFLRFILHTYFPPMPDILKAALSAAAFWYLSAWQTLRQRRCPPTHTTAATQRGTDAA